MHTLWFEFTLALRRLARRRAQNGLMLVTFAVSVTLSLLSWTLFQTVHLSQPDFDRQGEYYVMSYSGGAPTTFRTHSTREEMEAYRAGQTVFSEFMEVGYYNSLFIQTPTGEGRFLGAYLSSKALLVTQARPLLGRLFTVEDDQRGANTAVLLSQRMWENCFGSDPDVVGKTVLVTGYAATVVGVMPDTFRFPNDQEVWLSYGSMPNSQRNPMRDALVKLKPGITRERAVQDLNVILERLGPESPANKNKQRPALTLFRDYYLPSSIKVSALILFALGLLFVLVSCANAANLMLIDFLGRRAEIATGLSLGIPRGAAMRAVVWQVGMMAVVAGLISLMVLPAVGPWLFERIKFINAPYWLAYHFHWQYVGVALGLAAFCAFVTVIAPLCYLMWLNPDRVIREHAYASRGSGRSLWRRGLLVGQIAVLTMLGVTAGLLVRSSYNVSERQWGYPAGKIFLAKMSNESVDTKAKWTGPERLVIHRRALEELKARPETEAAALVTNPPGYSIGANCTYGLTPGDFGPDGGLGEAYQTEVTEDYFKVLDVPFVSGEVFAGDTVADAPVYVVINESLARRLWPGGDALQRTLYLRFPSQKETDPPVALVVCGVVRDFQANGPIAKTNDAIFIPFGVKRGTGAALHFVVRDHAGVPGTRSLVDALHRVDARISLYFPSTIKSQIELSLSSMQMTADLTTVFALAALVLGAIGIYSLTVAQVLQSAREFGIRMALGAEPGQLWAGFTRGHLLTALIGVALGLVGASQLVRVLRALLFGVNPYSVATYAGVALAILVVAVLACVPSLRRLRRINPADCLRSL